MGLNWSKGLIAAGTGLKEYSAIKAKEEYLAAQNKIAADQDLMGAYETLYKGVSDEINSINSSNQMGGSVDASLQPRLKDLYEYQGMLVRAIRTRQRITDEAFEALTSISGNTTVHKEGKGEETDGMWNAIKGFFNASAADLGVELEKIREELKTAGEQSGSFVADSRGMLVPQDPAVLEGMKKNAKDKLKKALDWWKTIKLGAGNTKETDEEEYASPLDGTGMASSGGGEGGLITAGEQAALDQRFSAEAIFSPRSTAQAGSGMSEEELTQLIKENTRQQDESVQAEKLNNLVGTEAALSSLGAIGGPVAEPAGESTIVEFIIGKPSSKIKVSSPEVENKKSISISNALGAIRSVESNANGYTAVKGSKSGDPGLTTSTVREAVKKHKDKAIGIGQFKYKEFMVPTAKKWFGMTEEQLKGQMLTPQFQDALVIAGLYDAGLEQYAEGSISLDQFQKRIANIWRGLPPDKNTKKGDVTDKYGNKAGMSGIDLQNRMQKGLLSN